MSTGVDASQPSTRVIGSTPLGLSWGVALPTFPGSGSPSLELLIETASLAETLGFAKAWAWDHVIWHRPRFESIISVTAALGATSTISVGPGVMQMPLRRPEVLGHQMATLASMYPGRVHLGVGSGQRREEFDALGVDFVSRWSVTRTNTHRVAEFMLDADAARSGEGELGVGRPTGGGQARPSAVEVWVGGRSAAAQRLACEYGGWLPAFATAEQISVELSEMSRLHGPAIPPRVGTILPIGPMGDRGAGQRWMARLFDVKAYPSRLVLPGDDEAIRSAVGEFIDAGVNHVCLLVADDHPGPTLEWVAEVLGVGAEASAT